MLFIWTLNNNCIHYLRHFECLTFIWNLTHLVRRLYRCIEFWKDVFSSFHKNQDIARGLWNEYWYCDPNNVRSFLEMKLRLPAISTITIIRDLRVAFDFLQNSAQLFHNKWKELKMSDAQLPLIYLKNKQSWTYALKMNATQWWSKWRVAYENVFIRVPWYILFFQSLFFSFLALF